VFPSPGCRATIARFACGGPSTTTAPAQPGRAGVAGARRRAARSLRRVREYVADNGGAHFDAAAIERAYRAELEWRQRQRKLGALATLKPNGLRAEIRLAEHLIDKSCELGTDAWRWWTFYRDQARRELASRPPEAGRPKGGRKNCEKLPDLRALGERQQAALWATAEEALAEVRAERGPQRLVIVRSVPRAGGDGGEREASGAAGEAQGLIARLKARKGDGP
jgi:hypothetical protein